jgi:hypothetical protein
MSRTLRDQITVLDGSQGAAPFLTSRAVGEGPRAWSRSPAAYAIPVPRTDPQLGNPDVNSQPLTRLLGGLRARTLKAPCGQFVPPEVPRSRPLRRDDP